MVYLWWVHGGPMVLTSWVHGGSMALQSWVLGGSMASRWCFYVRVDDDSMVLPLCTDGANILRPWYLYMVSLSWVRGLSAVGQWCCLHGVPIMGRRCPYVASMAFQWGVYSASMICPWWVMVLPGWAPCIHQVVGQWSVRGGYMGRLGWLYGASMGAPR